MYPSATGQESLFRAPHVSFAATPKLAGTAPSSTRSSIDGHQKPKVRTKSGCWTCRRRKIKCDEGRPGCHRCQVARVECEGYGGSRPSSVHSAASRPVSIASSPASVATGRSRSKVCSRRDTSEAGDTAAPVLSTSEDANYPPPAVFFDTPGAVTGIVGATEPVSAFPPLNFAYPNMAGEPVIATATSIPYELSEAFPIPSIDDNMSSQAPEQLPGPSSLVDFDSLFGLSKQAPDAAAYPGLQLDDQAFLSTALQDTPQAAIAHMVPHKQAPPASPVGLMSLAQSLPPLSASASTATVSPALGTPASLMDLSPSNPTISMPQAATVEPVIIDFAPQPPVDPILQASSAVEYQRRHAARQNLAPRVPTLRELDVGPCLAYAGTYRVWQVPAKIAAEMAEMENQRHVELLRHYFTNTCGLFNTIDHPLNPFRTFVAEHASQSLSLLHAVLAIAAINQSPLSPDARAESLLYFEASVDLYIRSLQQEDDISLFTLLLLSLYYVFDTGITQSEHFSQRAQYIIAERFELLSGNYLEAQPDFRFLVRLHVFYEVLANLSHRPGDLRDLQSCSDYSLSNLLKIIEIWDGEEAKQAASNNISNEYRMLGLLGVPTFFIKLLNETMNLKEEQASILAIDQQAMDERGRSAWKALFKEHFRKVHDLESRLQGARPGKLVIPPEVADALQVHRAVSVRFFDLFRLASSIHIMLELHSVHPKDSRIQQRVKEMVHLLGNIEQNSNYNTSGIWAFFIAGSCATDNTDRSILHRRLDSTWNSPCGNIWSLRSVLDECWQSKDDASPANEEAPKKFRTWKDIANARGWSLLIM